MGFIMPRPLPPIPPTIEGMRRQRERARQAWEREQHRPYDWQRDGL